jgi:hypothetical protein
MVYIILFEEIEEFDEQKQKVINKEDRRLYRHECENRFLWKSSENYYVGVIDDVYDRPTLMIIFTTLNNGIKNIKTALPE